MDQKHVRKIRLIAQVGKDWLKMKLGKAMAVNERAHFVQADQHIADCKAHIARQRQIIQRATERGDDVQWAEELLGCFEASLRNLEGHRQLILERLKAMEQQ